MSDYTDSNDSIDTINCEVTGCNKQMFDYTSCCDIPLCESHYVMYPSCSRKSCNANDEYMCIVCLDRNVYYCPRCMITFCDDCNTKKILRLEGCKCYK